MRRRLLLSVGGAAALALLFFAVPGAQPGASATFARVRTERGRTSARDASTLRLLPSSGAGYTAATRTLKGTRGEVLTFTRAGTADCNGTSLGANVPCVVNGRLQVRASNGTTVLAAENATVSMPTRASSNLLAQSDAVEGTPWSNSSSSTPILTANTWDYGFGLIGETMEDDDATVYEGRGQVVNAPGATGDYTLSCYLQAGTSTGARLLLDMAGVADTPVICAFTDLDGTTKRKACSFNANDPAMSGVNVFVQAGTSAVAVGNIKVGGCMLNRGTSALPYEPTSATGGRTWSPSTRQGAIAVDITWEPATSLPPNTFSHPFNIRTSTTNGITLWVRNTNGSIGVEMGDASTKNSISTGALTWVTGQRYRVRLAWSSAGLFLYRDGVLLGSQLTPIFPSSFPDTFNIGNNGGAGTYLGSPISNLCLSASPGGCVR